VITKVVPGGPADEAGLRIGSGTETALGVDFPSHADVIVSIAGRRVTGSEDIARIVTSLSAGQVTPFVVQRGATRRTLAVRLGRRSVSSHLGPRVVYRGAAT
jgi:S1-C subfamily serine protease